MRIIVVVASLILPTRVLFAVETISPVFQWMKNKNLSCRFAKTPTRVANGLDACVGLVYCDNVRTKKLEKEATQLCKTEKGECPTLQKCADPESSKDFLYVEDAEASRPEAADLRKTDSHGRECWYGTPKPKAIWIEHKGEMRGLCGTPIFCKVEKKELPSVAVCDPVNPPTNAQLQTPENQNREPFPVLECPQIKSCVKKAIESYPSEPKQGSTTTSPQPSIVSTEKPVTPTQPTLAAPAQTQPSMTPPMQPMPMIEGSVARGARRAVPAGNNRNRSH